MAGNAVAAHLRIGGAAVTAIERDPTYAPAFSSLSARCIRQQFPQPVNIALPQDGLGFLRDAAANLSVDGDASALRLQRPEGSYLAGRDGADALHANHAVQCIADVQAVPLDPDLYFANGVSGHGMQQAPGVGRGTVKLVLHGAYRTLDLSPLSVARLAESRPLLERNII